MRRVLGVVAGVALAVGVGAAPACAAFGFAPSVASPIAAGAGVSPFSLAVGDFNGDN